METYGGRLSSSTRSRSVKNTHQTAASLLIKEEKYLDKLKSSSQKSLGREEEKLKKRLEKIENDRSKSPSRGYLGQVSCSAEVDPTSRSGSHLPGGRKRRESLPGTMAPRPTPGTGRKRAMSLSVGHQEELLSKKSVTFGGKGSDLLPVSSHSSPGGGHENIHDLYDMAIQTVASSDDMEFGASSAIPQKQKQEKHSSSDMRGRRPSLGSNSHVASAPASKATLDLKALKELEEILKDSRLYTTKKCRQLDAGTESSTIRQQKKRMIQLEQLLSSLKIGHKKEIPKVELDPMEVLNCSYLRLSKSNIESLERMVRESGRDPGIHAHSDVTDFELFEKSKDSAT
ncbi:uncharacterized protein [Haliotis asinina]|uniref:uncharacterized protein n=1 Tax=Haliotis asinina TaxID=109174 RepID=UPI0035319FA3